MTKLKHIFSNNKELIIDSLIHAGLIWISLAFSYNNFKEYFYISHNTFPVELKGSIKATFSWTIIMTVILSLVYGMRRNKRCDYLSIHRNIIIIFSLAIIINLVFHSYETPILIVQNLSIAYFTILLLLFNRVRKSRYLDALSWVRLQDNIVLLLAFLKEKTSRPFTISFIFLLAICGLFLIAKQEEIVERLEDIAYFSLFIGVGIELYQLMKQGNVNGKKED